MSEDNSGAGKPHPFKFEHSSPGTHNVGTGQAPSLQSSQANSTFQPSPVQVNPARQKSSALFNPELQPFLEGLQQLGLELTEQQLDRFLRYRQELLEWNTRINLTAISYPHEVLLKHFLDSLSLLMAYVRPEASLLDIGAGAGFPGIPLKIVRPQWQVILLEATGKKVTFLQHIIETLQLTNTAAVQGRAEEMAHKSGYRAAFDVVTARAVASLPTLLEYAAPFCREGGQIILPKKGDLAEELAQGKRAASQLGVRFKADIPVTLPGLDDGRRLMVWEQVRTCPERFPRSSSVMVKKPLGSAFLL